jgi:UDP-N-acetylglucosamine 2-epimerase (non-hydrolysing)
MSVNKVLTVFGTRPEAIKMAPVIKQLNTSRNLCGYVCVTAQHRQMLDQVLEIFNIIPDYDLNVMKKDQDLFDITASVLKGMKQVLEEVRPDIVLVQGDTTTTFAVGLAAFYLKIPVGHIEAGLRTYDKFAPFPEEVNRCMTTAVADLHFAPTKWARDNLINEGIPPDKVFITGNTVVDALNYAINLTQNYKVMEQITKKLPFDPTERKYVLITGHRRESFGDGFRNICRALRQLAEKFHEYEFVYPVHLNPNVQKPVEDILKNDRLSNVHLIEPLSYLPFIYLMKHCYFVLTDSGGIQEEALTFRKPVLVMRNTTERPEGIEIGAVSLVGNNQKSIIAQCQDLLSSQIQYKSMVTDENPYGDGKAAARIVDIITKKLQHGNPYKLIDKKQKLKKNDLVTLMT